MSRTLKSASLAIAIVLGSDHAASAQVVAYRHRSTVWGDHLAGASELVRARGAFLRDEAAAAEAWARAEAARDELHYQRTEYRYQVKLMRFEYLKEKAEARRERDAARTATEEEAAVRILQQAQTGGVLWPTALKRAEYANSMALIESVLRAWSPDMPTTSDAYRRALATEAGVLRTRIAGDANIDFNRRVEAVQTLRRLQTLAAMTVHDTAGSHLAMK